MRSGGFIFGRVTQAGNGAEDRRIDETADGPLQPAVTSGGEAASETAAEAPAPTVAELTELGLPIRVRQASLAPQLRDTPPGSAAESAAVGGGFTLPRRGAPAADSAATRPAEPGPASPEAARNVVSALQRGWQLGRAEPDPEPAEPAADETGTEGDETDED